MPKFCEYCGSENTMYSLRCHSCYAPFSIKAKRVVDDDGNVTWETAWSDFAWSLLPLIVIIGVVVWISEKIATPFKRLRSRGG